jgi:subtilisin-like proprotein convertase family protein
MNKTTALFARTAFAAALTAGAMSSAFAGIYTTNAGGPIPDNNATGISSTITVTDTGPITSFDFLTVRGLTHTFLGDLVVTLSHNGTTVDILDRVGRNNGSQIGDSSNLNGDYTFRLSGNNFNAAAASANNLTDINTGVDYMTWTNTPNGGSSSANGSLSDFVGQAVDGTWTLTLSDRDSIATGSFAGFTFGTHNRTAEVPLPGSVALLGLGLLGLAARRRQA